MSHTHPNSIFRWEDAASLEHACWQCPTKANSPRAIQTCYGIHSMPCTSYHPTMHAVGAAHRCSGCINTREMHESRHREIAELVAEYKELEASPPVTPTRAPLQERNVNVNAGGRLRRETPTVQSDRQAVHNGFLFEDGDDLQGMTAEEDDTASLLSSTPSMADGLATPSKKLTKAELRVQKKAKKSVKSQNKALKNQSRLLSSVTHADVERIAEILHGEEQDVTLDGSAHPLATDRTIEDVISRNLNFCKNIQAHKQYLFKSIATGRREAKERQRLKKRESKGEVVEDAIEMQEVVSAIMIKLGLSATVVAASAASSPGPSVSAPIRNNTHTIASGRKRTNSSLLVSALPVHSKISSASRPIIAIASKLRIAIKADLEKHENEAHARYVRAGGFWRYVGKTVFERMTDIARELDVSSGERWEKKRTRQDKLVGKNVEIFPDPAAAEDDDDGREE